MSDLPPPPPPPPGGGQAPPPPPPNLVAPSGYVAYTPSPMGSVPLQRVGKVHTASVVLVALTALLSFLPFLTLGSARDKAQAFLDGDISSSQFVEDTAAHLFMSVFQGVALLAAAVVTIIWMFRMAKNHRSMHRGGTWGPAWAIAGWILPPLLFIIPFLMFRELWKASDPTVAIGGDWKSNSASPLTIVWFVTYSLIPIVLLGVQTGDGVGSFFGAAEEDLAQQIVDSGSSAWLSAGANVLGAAAFIMLARQLTTRHRALTGET